MIVLFVSMFLFKNSNQAIKLFPFVLIVYVPISYFFDSWMYRRYQRIKERERQARRGVQ